MNRRLLTWAIFVLLSGAATAFAQQKVFIDWDHKVDFSGYRTYAWAEIKNRAPSELTHKRILDFTDEQLASKGLRKVDSNPDLYLVYNAGTQLVSELYDPNYVPWASGGENVSETVLRLKATLVIDLVDAGKKQLVFRGIAKDTVSEDPQQNAKKVKKAVENIFKRYPPK
ncbi:MAG: DUF4136 domain-containing protein [Acidobacteria bacterium]|nr:DUF4136 domain-containing protein [Acidobacteriota bacterium]MBI3485214.1 DUF4136 domain-containing protein [Acidobacteriota bacterium]